MQATLIDNDVMRELYTLFKSSTVNRKTQALEFYGYHSDQYESFETKIRMILGWTDWQAYQALLELTALRRGRFRAKTVKNIDTFSDPLAELAVVKQGHEYTVQQRLTLIKWWLYRKVYSHGGDISE